MKAVRVKTVWFRKGAARSPAELASVIEIGRAHV